MAFKTADTHKNEQQGEKIAYTVEVTRVTLTENEHRVLFDARVNGVSISGFGFCEYTNQQGEQGNMVQFPQRKGKGSTGEAKYYNIVWFPVSRELKEDIEKQICKFIDGMS